FGEPRTSGGMSDETLRIFESICLTHRPKGFERFAIWGCPRFTPQAVHSMILTCKLRQLDLVDYPVTRSLLNLLDMSLGSLTRLVIRNYHLSSVHGSLMRWHRLQRLSIQDGRSLDDDFIRHVTRLAAADTDHECQLNTLHLENAPFTAET